MIKKRYNITPAKGILIKHKGDFDLDRLYKSCKDWFDSKKYEFTEKEHTEKTKPEGNELLMKLIGEREIDDYVKFKIETYFFILEINKKDRKVNAILKINIEAEIELDYKNVWQKTQFTKFLFFIYNNYIIKRRIEKIYENKLFSEVIEYSDTIKSILGLN